MFTVKVILFVNKFYWKLFTIFGNNDIITSILKRGIYTYEKVYKININFNIF